GVSFDQLRTDSVPALVADAVAAVRRAGPDPVDWVYQSFAYDTHDVGTTPGFGGDTVAALRSIRAPVLLLVPELDLYNPIEDAIEAAAQIPNATLVRVAGHGGDPVGAGRSPRIADARRASG